MPRGQRRDPAPLGFIPWTRNSRGGGGGEGKKNKKFAFNFLFLLCLLTRLIVIFMSLQTQTILTRSLIYGRWGYTSLNNFNEWVIVNDSTWLTLTGSVKSAPDNTARLCGITSGKKCYTAPFFFLVHLSNPKTIPVNDGNLSPHILPSFFSL